MAQFDDASLDDDLDPRPKDRKPIIIGGAVVAVAVVGFFVISGGGPSLSKEELAVFEEAQTALRTDDYNHFPEGEKKLLNIVEKYPDHAGAITWLMQMYCAWGETLKFESMVFQTAARAKGAEVLDLKKTAENSKSKKARANAQKAFDDGKAQIEELNKAGKLKDEQGTTYLKKAKEWAKKGSEVAYDDPQLQRAMADHARITDKWPDVETRLGYVKKHKPDSAGYRFIMGGMLMDRDKKFDEAVKYFEEALQVDPKFTKAQYFVGVAQDKKGDRDKAAEAMKKVLVMSPGHPGARAYLGMVSIMDAAKAAQGQAALAGTDAEKVEPGDEVAPPAAAPAKEEAKVEPAAKKKKKK